MTYETYNGTIIAIDCQDPPTAERHGKSRIKIQYGQPQETDEEKDCGFELISFDLPESYVGRYINVVNNSSRRTPNDQTIRTQELIFNNGLERILITDS